MSGVQPTGELHLGNYLGSIQNWIKLLNTNPDSTAYLMIADQHAITVFQDPKILKEKTLRLAAIYRAAGFDTNKHIIFVQSQNPDHTYLGWIFNCVTPIGWLERMTQFKDKKQKMETYKSVVSTGLLAYPTLMAADILLYSADKVPVGKDQKQHVELTCDIAARFNQIYGETFIIPEFVTDKVTTKILDLQNPSKKMSKSDDSPLGKIELTDTPDTIRQKISRAVTDSESEIRFDPENKPGVSNLLSIYAAVTKESIDNAVNAFAGKTYSQFKDAVAEAIIAFLAPFNEKLNYYLSDKAQLQKDLDLHAEKARTISHEKLVEVSNKLGLYYS